MFVSMEPGSRSIKTQALNADFAVVGGGLAGTCAAITAAREGLKVILIQDRPVLGGNASSEVRLWVLGATAHMGNNNRWAREGGLINEILEENLFRNPLGNSLIFDTILLEKCDLEPNLTLLLNTAIDECLKNQEDMIAEISGYCSQNSTRYHIKASQFCDASGDGVLGFLAGAAFRMGAEQREEFNEGLAPDAQYGELLGHSLYFYTKDVGCPAKYVPPSFALKDITSLPRYQQFKSNMQGCQLWWIEYGGRLDTVHQSEDIKWELWRIVYGVWNYIKNSGEFPEAENLTLEWVGHIPGKRESRRFEGEYMLHQSDVIEQTHFEDAVAHGGWSIDLHPADGVYAKGSPSNHWHSKGMYGIPYRCYYSRNIVNLFMAGRLISASHVAFGTIRVMGTCAAGGQAIGMAAAMCKEKRLQPKGVAQYMNELQVRLDRQGQFLPHWDGVDPQDLTPQAEVSCSSSLNISEFKSSGEWMTLTSNVAMLLPLDIDQNYKLSYNLRASHKTKVCVQLGRSKKDDNHGLDEVMEEQYIEVDEEGVYAVNFETFALRAGYHFFVLLANPDVEVALSDQRYPGILSLHHRAQLSGSKGGGTQNTALESGVESFDFWLPGRRPDGKNLALTIDPPIAAYAAHQIAQAPSRPTVSVNSWVPEREDLEARICLKWPSPVSFNQIVIEFDPDWDHAMESVLYNHADEISPFMARDFELSIDDGDVLEVIHDHRWARFLYKGEITCSCLKVKINNTENIPPAIYRVRTLKL